MDTIIRFILCSKKYVLNVSAIRIMKSIIMFRNLIQILWVYIGIRRVVAVFNLIVIVD